MQTVGLYMQSFNKQEGINATSPSHWPFLAIACNRLQFTAICISSNGSSPVSWISFNVLPVF